MATKRTFFGSCFVHVVEVFIESTVSSDEVGCSSVSYVRGEIKLKLTEKS